MSIIFMLIFFSILVAGGFLFAFFKAVRTGQFDDMETPAMRIYLDEEPTIVNKRNT
ncbi:MAG TPA: cbb3-type cytochrome oxidase assembly protein CcoS [Candidatus Kapabacteria bacterium]|jgi:cbb3-type cytochrome oxidase maturation protein|nr:cbb3-type cytochrome oxidase assembly protein CcoS [Ignavibacteria bacterium]MBN8574822.1 cbb3-type cytochrome oxidase assembly protein CcoS [Candidatus Kapabacteria bacterium]HRE58484.1 cbb3-type cytochrome oxidase assembly protein CcoS [Candidatus Kapabacteria bacterium]HRI29916.1 cbb3-type cytochrome oxidase assembly protein CcoS [Candidatus Kapabacteria bacterium]HRK60585.1 cbb3-type cytochrome oxidase assembly protein CcoS [Candidatus Kapabacteria bacterium]